MNKMHSITWAALFLLSASFPSAASDYVSYSRRSNETNNITIPTGQTWELVTYTFENGTGNGGCSVYASHTPDNQFYLFQIPATDGLIIGHQGGPSGIGSSAAGLQIPGPALLKINETTGNYFLVFKKSVEALSMVADSTSIIVPHHSAGDIDIKLEQSADNVTWTECLPGTYNSSTVKRFFRLRAVEK